MMAALRYPCGVSACEEKLLETGTTNNMGVSGPLAAFLHHMGD